MVKRVKVRALLFSLLFCTSLLLVTTNVPSTTAYDYGYGNASIIYSSQFDQPSDDLMRANWVTTNIYNLFAARGTGVYSSVENYHAAITNSIVLSKVQDCENHHPTTAIFYHGHAGKKDTSGIINYFLYEQPNPSYQGHVYDEDIYVYTANNHKFVFLWACMQADEVGGYVSGHARGMPYAWSHGSSMSNNGYVFPIGTGAFMGFENISRSISYWPTQSNTYENWITFFYYYLTNGNSVNSSLNLASEAVWGQNTKFSDTELYNGYFEYYNGVGWASKLHVYGNGALKLPY